jgi:YD repeat-containing protein
MRILSAFLLVATLSLAQHITYTYDAAQRLTRVDYSSGASISYAYDKAGNLLTRLVTGPGARPSITAAGVVNAASFKGGSVAPGEMVTIFGTGIGPTALAGFQIANGLVSGNVAATRFLFDGVPAPIIYVSASQSTVMVPFAVAGKASTQLVAEYQGAQSAPVTIPVVAAIPGLFTITQNGSGAAAIVNQDGSINSRPD